MSASLVGSEMCIRDRSKTAGSGHNKNGDYSGYEGYGYGASSSWAAPSSAAEGWADPWAGWGPS
eukprot:1950287-Alexandrium_andersonii.AAC.1